MVYLVSSTQLHRWSSLTALPDLHIDHPLRVVNTDHGRHTSPMTNSLLCISLSCSLVYAVRFISASLFRTWLCANATFITLLFQERKETPRCDKSHVCPDHPRCTTSIKVVMSGGVLDVVNSAKFHPNRFRGFGSLRGRNLSFSYAWHYGVYNRLGLQSNL